MSSQNQQLSLRLWQVPGEVGGNTLESQEPTLSCEEEIPHQKSLLHFLSKSLVVGQEFSLACLLLVRHRVLIQEEQHGLTRETEWYAFLSNAFLSVTMFIMILCSIFIGNNDGLGRRDKAMVRATDALLLGGILRMFSGLLRSLTESYSSDTVYALAIFGIIIHILSCDYAYANGRISSRPPVVSAAGRNGNKRPEFLGGTMSLNAVLFSTTLLVSRLKSNTSSYILVSSVIVLFAFYPAARHNIATSRPSSLSGLPGLLITIGFVSSTVVLLETIERLCFMCVFLCICVVGPAAKWCLQPYKKIIRGPWDIAHVSVVDASPVFEATPHPLSANEDTKKKQ